MSIFSTPALAFFMGIYFSVVDRVWSSGWPFEIQERNIHGGYFQYNVILIRIALLCRWKYHPLVIWPLWIRLYDHAISSVSERPSFSPFKRIHAQCSVPWTDSLRDRRVFKVCKELCINLNATSQGETASTFFSLCSIYVPIFRRKKRKKNLPEDFHVIERIFSRRLAPIWSKKSFIF